MLTLPQIVQRVNERRHQSAKYVRILQIKKGWDSLGRGYVASASYSTKIWDPYKRKFVNNKERKRYVTVIVFLDPRLHVVVSCSCADFKYRWEVALNHKQAAEIEYSNGELPVIRNPTMRAAQCKHLVALYNKIKDQLPKRRANDNTPAINPPQVQIPPSQRKPIKPVKIKAPTNVQRSVKPGKKQSTLPRSTQQQQPKAPPPPPTPAAKPGKKSGPAMMHAPSKPGKKPVSKSGPAMMKAPGSKSKPASKPAAKPAPKSKSGPAMMAPKVKPAPAPSKSGPAMMRSRK